MKRIILLIFISFFFQLNTFAQCEEDDEAKILLVGDSWAFFMSVDLTLNTIFERWGHTGYKFITTINLAENGAQTDDFLETNKQEEIQLIIDNTPSIKAVHLSIGGNDFLGDWNVDMTVEEVDTLKEDVMGRLESVVDFIKGTRPDIKVVLSGYTYPNFEEVIEDTDPFQELHPFYDRWEGMGFPSFLEINNLLNDVSILMEDYANSDPQIEFINATGVLQHTFGQEDPLGIPPGGTYEPGTTPLPNGIPNMPSPKDAMRDYELTKDCFHLSPKAYRDFINYQTQKFYHKFLMDDQYILAENIDYNGSVSSTEAVYPDLFLGEIDGESFSTILTFETSSIPTNAIVEKAQIFLRVENIEGDTPIGNQLNVKIKNGSFGESFNLEAADYLDEGDTEELSCRYGSSNSEGRWIRLDLPNDIIPFISNDLATQFMISSTNTNSGRLSFTGIDNPEFAPVLNLKFDPSSITSISNEENWNTQIRLFPNPTSGQLHIENNGIEILQIQILNVMGEKISNYKNPSAVIECNDWAKGIYLIQIHTEKGILSKKIVKD